MTGRLGVLSLLSLLGCAGLEYDNATPRCSESIACPADLSCYRGYCVESDAVAEDEDAGPSDRASRDADIGVSTPSPAARDASVALHAGQAAVPAPDAAIVVSPPPAAPPVATPTPAPVVPVTPAAPVMPSDASANALRWPWSIDQLKNVPSHLLGCLGSCTILGKQECERCIAEKNREQDSGSDEDSCDEDDENDERNEGRGRGNRCGRSR